MQEEMAAHLELQAEANRARGMDAEEARYAALRQFGGVAQVQERCREQRGWVWLDQVARDVRYVVRTLWRSPVFTTTSVLILALGIGATTVLFGVVNALMLRPLPVPQPGALRFLNQVRSDSAHPGFSFPAFRRLRDNSGGVATVAAFISASPTVACTANGPSEPVHREYVSASYFPTLGLVPAAGRFFVPEEDTRDSTMVIIGYNYWRRHFGCSPAAIGATLSCNGRSFTIVGVAPTGFSGIVPEKETQVWFQISNNMWRHGRCDPLWGASDTANEWYRLLVRLQPGVSETQAAGAFAAINDTYLRNWAWGLEVPARAKLLARSVRLETAESGYSFLGRQYLRPLVVLLVLVGLLLLLTCLNIGGLLLARTAARSRELAVRLAVGAGRGQLVRLLAIESLVLAGLGGTIGCLVAVWGAPVLAGIYDLTIDVGPDAAVLGGAWGVSMVCGLLFGLLPAFKAGRETVALALNGAPTRPRASRWSAARCLVAVQMAFALVLVFGAALFSRSLGRLYAVPAGFASERLVLCDLVTAEGRTAVDREAVDRLCDRLCQMPDVISVGAGRPVPSSAPPASIVVDGYVPQPGESMLVPNREIGAGYFETMGVPIVAGRQFSPQDAVPGSPPVIVVNASFARRFYGETSPLGRTVEVDMSPVGGGNRGRFEIVGVVADARFAGLRNKPQPEFYLPWGGSTLFVRTTAAPEPLLASLNGMVQREEPGLRASQVRTLEQAIGVTLAQDRMLASLSGLFGGLALFIAALGVYGAVAQATSRRTREIAIRMALGGQRLRVLALMMKDTLGQLLLGVSVGVVGAIAGGRCASPLLYELEPGDPILLVAVVSVLGCAALVSCWLPARRAVRINPVEVLRAE